MGSVKYLPSKGEPLLSSAILMDKASVTLEAVKRVIKQEKEMDPQEPSSTEAPWKSVLIGSNKKNKTGARPRFLDDDGRWDWDRWDSWIPPQPIESIQATITIPPESFDDNPQKGSWDRWDAWSPPNPVESTTKQTSYLLYMEEKRKNKQKQRISVKSKVQDVGDRRYDVEEVDSWALQDDGTSTRTEATTQWQSVLMMPKSQKRRKWKTTRRPTPVTQQYIKDTTTAKIDRDWNDSYFYYDQELLDGEERNGKVKKEDLKYSEMEAEFGGWEKNSSAVNWKQSVLNIIMIIHILVLATEKTLYHRNIM